MLQKYRLDLAYSTAIIGILLALMALWPGLLQNWLKASGFIPHGHCYLWQTPLVSLHVTSDTLTGLSYVSISATLAYLIYRGREAIPFHWMFLAFGLFILACGSTHFMEVVTLWIPVYWLSGSIKLTTAIVSVATAMLLPPLIPKILDLIAAAKASEERREQLEQANRDLQTLNQQLAEQISERQRTESVIRFSSFLSEASNVLTASLNPPTTLAGLIQLIVPALADYCVIDLVDRDGSINRVEPAHMDPEQAVRMQTLLQPYQLDARHPSVARDVLQQGRSKLMNQLTYHPRQPIAQKTEPFNLLSALQPQAAILVPLILQGRVLGVITMVATAPDRTYGPEDLALAEELARRAALALENARLYQEAQEVSQMKDQFLAVVSHELRTPLNAMLGWAQTLQNRQLNQETTYRALQTIERNARLQAQLIDDILDFSRIIRGQLRLQMRPVELTSILETVLTSIRPTAEAKHIQLDTDFQTTQALMLGDADRLHQIIWNLLSNAIKFTPEAGRISVYLEQADSRIQMRFVDTGIGINAEFLPYVFEHFRQADSSTTRSHGGLGLGLAIVRQLTELQGGIVYAESPGEGLGATFTVVFPRLPESASTDLNQPVGNLDVMPDSFHPTSPRVRLTGYKILVVDDEADARELMAILLEEQGANVITAASAVAALELLQRSSPDLLISDIGMPEQDGYDLIRAIRTAEMQQGQSSLPAVALTAYTRDQDRQKALAAGFQAHLTKPIGPDELMQAIAQVLQPSRSGSLLAND